MGEVGDDPRRLTLAALLASGVPRHHRRGTRLFQPGDIADEALFVRTGLAKVTAPRLDGGDVVLALRGPGTWLDGQSIAARRSRVTGAVALADISIIALQRAQLFAALHDHPELSRELVLQLGGSLSAAFGDLRAQASGDTVALLARRLAELVSDPMFSTWRSARPDSITVRMPISQLDLASWAGISPRAATAALRRLREDGIISTGRMRVDVHDPVALESRAAALG